MKAFHTLRTKNGINFSDFEIFVMILSALKWRERNGEIFIVTDTDGKNFLEEVGIISAWDGIKIFLDEIDELGIDEKIFWAGSKLYALSKIETPCVMIDLDFIVWHKINFENFKSDIAVIHREDKNLACYPDEKYFRFKENFTLPPLNWEVEPCNTALAYFGDENFVEAYTNFAFEFMKNVLSDGDNLKYMVFAEQRWLAMCAEKFDVKIYSLSNLAELFGSQKSFTHIWGEKKFLRENLIEAEKFCRNCAVRLEKDFPDFAKKFSEFERFKKYFEGK